MNLTPRHWALSLLFLMLPFQLQAEPVLLDRIVAIVNEDAISATQLKAEIDTIKLQLAQQRAPIPPLSILEKQVLERLISRQLQLQLARANNIVVDENTLNRAITNIAEQNQLSLTQFRNVLKDDGYDFVKFREDIRTEIIATRLRQRQVDNRINVSEGEINQFLAQQKSSTSANDEYRLGHILVSVPEAASADEIKTAKTQALAVLTRLKQGEDFQQVAIAESNGQKALSGGDLGWRKAGQLPTLFASVVPTMAVGDIGEPIRSPSGFHLIKLLEHRGGERHVVLQTLARHILIRPNELTTEEETIRKLHELKARIEDGDDFADIARAHSEDKASAIEGGDLGWASPGVMVPAFELIMKETPIDTISEPFQTQFGWHILQVLAQRDYDNTEEFKRSNARKQLMDRKISEEQEVWLRRMREEAYVDIRLAGS